MSAHQALNVQVVETFVRDSFGPGMPNAVKMVMVCGICVGTAIGFTAVTSKDGQQKKLLRLHITMSVTTGALAFVFFAATPWPAGVTDREFDNKYAHLPGYAEGLIVGMAYPFLLALLVTIVSVKQADRRTVTGRGLMFIVPGAAILTVYAALRIGYLSAARYGVMEPTPTPLEISRVLAATGALLVAVGVLVALTMNWLAARTALQQILPLRDELMKLWPGAVRESMPGASTSECVDDRAAEVLDALSIEVDFSDLPTEGTLPQEAAASAIAEWIVAGRVADGLGYSSFFHDPETTDTEWACMVGAAYNAIKGTERKAVLK